MQIHNRRERDHSNSNPDIDYTRTAENYSLKDTELSYNRSINKRIEGGYTGKKALRKDAVRMCELLFTSDNAFFTELSNEQERAFLRIAMISPLKGMAKPILFRRLYIKMKRHRTFTLISFR